MVYGSYILAALLGYFFGSLPFGFLVARAHGVVIFKAGSGNPGATNVRRVLGSRAGNLVFALDMLKGALAAALPLLLTCLSLRLFAGKMSGWQLDEQEAFRLETMNGARLEALVGVIAAVLGHSFSVFTRFKGGKGVATAAGGLVVLMPLACGIGGTVFALTFILTRSVSLGSILAAVAVPTASWLLHNPLPLNIVATVLGLFVIIRHRTNVRRLLSGTENKFAKKPAAQA